MEGRERGKTQFSKMTDAAIHRWLENFRGQRQREADRRATGAIGVPDQVYKMYTAIIDELEAEQRHRCRNADL